MDSRDFPLSFSVKRAILNGIFNYKYEIHDFQTGPILGQSYFEYYQKAVENCSTHGTTNTHQNIVNLVNLLKQPDATRSSVEIALRKQLSDNELEDSCEIIADSINLTMRLLLMMPTGVFTAGGRPIAVSVSDILELLIPYVYFDWEILQGDTKLNWKDGTVIELVSDEISP